MAYLELDEFPDLIEYYTTIGNEKRGHSILNAAALPAVEPMDG